MTQSAGILLYRRTDGMLEVLLGHPGGPFWKNKDDGAWSIPKGEFDSTEEPLQVAIREFAEETGAKLIGDFTELEPVKMKSGKVIHAFALESDFDTTQFKSNHFEMEWPPKSGRTASFPEIDRVEWMTLEDAYVKIVPAQTALLKQLEELI